MNLKTTTLYDVHMIHVNRLAVKQSDFLDYLYRNRKESRDIFDKRVKDLIRECVDNRADYIDSDNTSDNSFITLTTKGGEQYSISYLFYLFFNNAYTKTILIGIIMIFVTSYITNNIIDKFKSSHIEKENTQPVFIYQFYSHSHN